MFGRKKPAPKPSTGALQENFLQRLDSLIADHRDAGDRQIADILEMRASALRLHLAMTRPVI